MSETNGDSYDSLQFQEEPPLSNPLVNVDAKLKSLEGKYADNPDKHNKLRTARVSIREKDKEVRDAVQKEMDRLGIDDFKHHLFSIATMLPLRAIILKAEQDVSFAQEIVDTFGIKHRPLEKLVPKRKPPKPGHKYPLIRREMPANRDESTSVIEVSANYFPSGNVYNIVVDAHSEGIYRSNPLPPIEDGVSSSQP